MAPKDPTRYQLSSRLAYDQHTPAFLQRLQNKVTGVSNDEEDEEDEWQAGSDGRPPIPRRPPPPQRPDDDPGSADEDNLDEKPQVVVLREGKHLTAGEAERYAENERRKARGLAPLPDSSKDDEIEGKDGKDDDTSTSKQKSDEKDEEAKSAGLSFSSSRVTSYSKKKRKTVGDGLDELVDKEKAQKKRKHASKAKKEKTGVLLSFGADEG